MPLRYLVNGKPERISAATKIVEAEKESQEAELTKPIKDDIEKEKDDVERISESSNEEIDRLRKIQ